MSKLLVLPLIVAIFGSAALTSAGLARAAGISVNGNTIVYTADAGELNRLLIQDNGVPSNGFKHFAVSDTGSTIRPGPGCSGSGNSVNCDVSLNASCCPSYSVNLGDQNDTMDVHSTDLVGTSFVHGGFGDDVLSGGPGPDVFDGDAGFDTVSYTSRTTSIGGSIGCQSSGFFCAPDGAKGENDDVGGTVEKVIGGSGADGLAAGVPTTVQHSLDGGAGNDLIVGNLGVNVLTGGSGQDSLSGFDGNDNLFANDGEPDSISCGTGLDAASIDLKDTLQDDSCESVQRAAVDQGPNVRIAAGSIRLDHGRALVTLSCPRSPEARCAGTLTLREIVGTRGRPATPKTKGTFRVLTRRLGSARYQLAIGRSAVVRVPVAGSTSREIQVTSVEPDANGKPKTTMATRAFHA